MKECLVLVFLIVCLTAITCITSPRSASTEEELFIKQMKESKKIQAEMECRPTFRKVDVRDLLLKSVPSEIVAKDNYKPRELFVPTCSNVCSHCDMHLGLRHNCTATAEEEKTFYIRYGRRRPLKYHLHKEMIAKECKCQPV
ncbi:uncharacterized protein LOC143038631 isoform X2 [Oratosquilla oratoria]|uniref:uncharacterized protein LOC143038631 isoform X2 n=1 Tax=Oratosquilla oratoria TaxID=337810 RepID=UPI003F7648E0